jgi:hypothetical protein
MLWSLQKDLEQVPNILEAIPDDRLQAMHDALRTVWTRFMYSSPPLYRSQADELLKMAAEKRQNGMDSIASLPGSHASQNSTDRLFEDDAFATIIGFLYRKMLS